MLREVSINNDWCDKTMSLMRERQFEACERRLWSRVDHGLFSPDTTDADAQVLLDSSYYFEEAPQSLLTIRDLRAMVLQLLPMEARYLPQGEYELLERLIIGGGHLMLTEWDDIGAAEALVSRLWCAIHMDKTQWILELPQELHAPLLAVMQESDTQDLREKLFRYDAMMMSLLYLCGFIQGEQPTVSFLQDVMQCESGVAGRIAKRYLQSTFEYIIERDGRMVLLHPGLADPPRLLLATRQGEWNQMELSQEMISGGMNGMLPEEKPLNSAMYASLIGAMRPEWDEAEAAEDLRMLAKQGVSLIEMETVLSTMLCILPTMAMKQALQQLHLRTPRWMGLQMNLQH